MPVYRIQDPLSGKTITMEGDHLPSRDDIDTVFETLRQSGQLPTKQQWLMDPNRKPPSAEQFTSKQDSGSALSTLLGMLPMAGGAIGGLIGGAPGAAAGGAAGRGYQQLGEHASEIPGAIKDVARNLIAHPIETARGIVGGTNTGGVDVATQAAVQGGLEGGGQLAAKYVVQPAARAVMRGYLKPSLAGSNIQQARDIVQTALDEALPVTKGGEVRAERLIGELNADINSTLAKVKGQIDLGQVANRVRAFAKAKYFKPGVDSADYNAALAVADAIDQHASQAVTKSVPITKTVQSPILDAGGKPIMSEVTSTEKVTTYPTGVSARRANDIKQAVRPPSRAYGQQSYVPETATRKVAGSAMRDAIERTASGEGFPNVATMNAREGRLIDAQDAVARAAGREENKGLNPTAVPNLLAGMYGAGEYGRGDDPTTAVTKALAARMLLSPAVATRAAILASKLARNGYSVANAARAAIAAVQSGAGQEGQNVPKND